jgi:hypothetical protein
MKKKDKNGFIYLIKKHEFEPSQFKRYEKDVDGFPAFILQFLGSPLFFMVRTNKEDYDQFDVRYIKFAPNFPKSDYYPDRAWTWIGDVYETFEYWLAQHVNEYRAEIDEPDLWELVEGKSLFGVDPLAGRNNDDFNKIEKEQIRKSLDEFKKKIELQFKPTSDQLEIISDRINYLSESVDRLNKVDWQGIAMSTIISISIALSLDTDNGRILFAMFRESFNRIVKLLGI